MYESNKTKVSGDVTLTAKWLKVSMLRFDSDGGSSVSGIYYGVYGTPLGTLPVPVKAGHTFKGWYYGVTEYTSETIYGFNESITLKAKWAENESSTVSNGKGLSVTGKFPAHSSLSVNSLNVNGSTYQSIVAKCKETTNSASADCILITLKGDGINDKLPLTVRVKANSSYNGKEVKVFYSLNQVETVTGKVTGGYLEFEAYGFRLSDGVQLSFGVQSGVMDKGSW